MARGAESGGTESPAGTPDPTSFVLERFDWTAPDRMELAGTFSGLPTSGAGAAVLVVESGDGALRLPAVEATGDGDGGWSAAFAWLQPPVAFDVARLELDDGLAVELPAPERAVKGSTHPVVSDAARQAVAGPATDVDGAAERVRLETEVLELRQQLEEVRAELERASEDRDRALADLESERRRHDGDLERFHEGLQRVRSTADEAQRAAAAARAEAEQRAAGEIAALRERVGELERDSAAADELRAAAEEARGLAQAMLDRLAGAADPPARVR